MDRHTFEEAFFDIFGKTRLGSHETNGLTNSELWKRIQKSSMDTKIVSFTVSPKLLIGAALAVSLTAAAMYSGIRYATTIDPVVQELQTSNTIKTVVQPKPVVQPKMVVVDENVPLLEKKAINQSVISVEQPQLTTPAKRSIVVASTTVEIAQDDSTHRDTSNLVSSEVLIDVVKVLHAEDIDTVQVEQKTVYVKAPPVSVKSKKVKYVKKRKASSE